MLVFAHLGLTLAAARQIACANLAFVMLGSMLPDIIDKSLGVVLFGTPAMGRTFAHTLLFLVLLGTAAYYLRDAGAGLSPPLRLAEPGRDQQLEAPGTEADQAGATEGLAVAAVDPGPLGERS